MGFAVPKTPAHSLMLLNRYMRTDMLQHIHVRLHKMRDENEPGSLCIIWRKASNRSSAPTQCPITPMRNSGGCMTLTEAGFWQGTVAPALGVTLA